VRHIDGMLILINAFKTLEKALDKCQPLAVKPAAEVFQFSADILIYLTSLFSVSAAGE
jgi:hypothetical protein